MRVTQSMLSSNMLRNLNTSYGKMAKLQEQIQSGSKITRPSDDPVVAIKGMGYRVDIDRVKQYQRNIGEAHTWLDTTDEALGQVGEAIKRVQELTVQAANDTNTAEDRQKIAAELEQLKAQMRDIANTKVGENYIFSGTHTDQPLYKDGTLNSAITKDGGEREFLLNVFDGISIQVNTSGKDLFSEIDMYMDGLINVVKAGTSGEAIGAELGDGAKTKLGGLYEKVLTERANVGARQNRVDLMENRLDIQEINVTKQMSINEDTDYAKAITEMASAESIHQASLSVGAKIIQQTLVDFIR